MAVIDGPCKGQQGVILAVLRDKKRVVIEGVNMVSVQLLSLCESCNIHETRAFK